MPWVTITQGARVDDDPPQGSAEDRLPHGASVDKDDCVDRLPHGATVFRLPHGPSVDELPHCGLPTNVSEFRLPHGVFEDRTSHGAWDTTAVLTVSSALRSASGHESGRNMRTVAGRRFDNTVGDAGRRSRPRRCPFGRGSNVRENVL